MTRKLTLPFVVFVLFSLGCSFFGGVSTTLSPTIQASSATPWPTQTLFVLPPLQIVEQTNGAAWLWPDGSDWEINDSLSGHGSIENLIRDNGYHWDQIKLQGKGILIQHGYYLYVVLDLQLFDNRVKIPELSYLIDLWSEDQVIMDSQANIREFLNDNKLWENKWVTIVNSQIQGDGTHQYLIYGGVVLSPVYYESRDGLNFTLEP